jgi:hypothetical protein
MARYELVAIFEDPDFDMGEEPDKFWFKSNALHRWREREKFRKELLVSAWRWHLIDTKTGTDITPNE